MNADQSARKIFTLGDVEPEKPQFEDRDGTFYDVNTAEHLSETDFKRLGQMTSEIQTLAREQGGDMGAQLAAMTRLLNQVMQLLIPALPAARIAALTINDKKNFLTWWGQEAQGKMPAAQPSRAQRRRRNRGRK